MIIFFGTFDVLLIFVLFFTLLTGAVDMLNNMITVLFVLFVIKNIVQDVIIGFFKNHNSILSTLWYLIVDTLRIGLYFYILQEYSMTYSKAGGLSFFGAIFNFLIFFFLGGILYLVGEVTSLSHCFKKESLSNHPTWFYKITDILTLGVLALFCWWGMS